MSQRLVELRHRLAQSQVSVRCDRHDDIKALVHSIHLSDAPSLSLKTGAVNTRILSSENLLDIFQTMLSAGICHGHLLQLPRAARLLCFSTGQKVGTLIWPKIITYIIYTIMISVIQRTIFVQAILTSKWVRNIRWKLLSKRILHRHLAAKTVQILFFEFILIILRQFSANVDTMASSLIKTVAWRFRHKTL